MPYLHASILECIHRSLMLFSSAGVYWLTLVLSLRVLLQPHPQLGESVYYKQTVKAFHLSCCSSETGFYHASLQGKKVESFCS